MRLKTFAEFVKTSQVPYTGPKYVVAPQEGDKGFELIRTALDDVKKTKTVDTGMWSDDQRHDNEKKMLFSLQVFGPIHRVSCMNFLC